MKSVMAIIQEYRADTSTGSRSKASLAFPHGLMLVLVLALLSTGANAQQIGRQRSGSSTLEIPQRSQAMPQKGASQPMQPGRNVLVIPRASRDFVGEWGGHLSLTRSVGIVPASRDSIVSLAFGETGGTVFMQTTAFASRSSQIVKTSADVVNPRTIRLKLRGLEMAFRPPIIHKEELHLALTAKSTITCLKYVDFYEPGRKVPIASMAYEGKLHLLTPEERRALTQQVLEKGQIPQQQIESSRRFGP
jgi:hypothetical protein